jgi:acetyl-CoA carboxylase carboxyltransferase component
MNAKNQRGASIWMTALVAAVFAVLSGIAAAEIVSTEEAAQQSDRERVQEFLQRDGVEDRLKQLGVAPEEARRRVDAMTPEEIQVVAGKIDTLAAGGALSSTDWIIILLLFIVILLIV